MNENGLYAFIYILFGFYLHQSVFHHYNKCTDTCIYGLSVLNMNRVIACLWIIRDSHCILVFCQHVGNYSDSNNSGIKMMKMPTYNVYLQAIECFTPNIQYEDYSMQTLQRLSMQNSNVNVLPLCLSGMFVILSCSFTSIFFLTNNFII